MPNVIRVGDFTSHGGKAVESGAPHITAGGKAVCLVGDNCECPIKGHQVCVIASGNESHIVNGKAVAYDGDKTSCGATLISTANNFSCNCGSEETIRNRKKPTAQSAIAARLLSVPPYAYVTHGDNEPLATAFRGSE